MMKKVFNWMLIGALMCGLGMSVTSCKDDDDDKDGNENLTPEEAEAKAADDCQTFWDVVSQLTSSDNWTADYKDKTFEPTIGEPSESNPLIRIVRTTDLQSAAERFANLVGATDFDENTDTYEWKNDVVGKLTWHKSTDNRSLATVDVDIKQLPKLQQIVYRSPEQSEDNGVAFQGRAYYRFGDVVSRVRPEDKVKEYWICVRPSFGPADKKKSHWVSLTLPPEKELWKYKASNGKDYHFANGLGKDMDNMHNFAEMLFAILRPNDWANNIQKNSSLRLFSDFYQSRYETNNKNFFGRVADAWKNYNSEDGKDLFQILLGADYSTLFQRVYTEGVSLIYGDLSWMKSISWNAYMQTVTYKNGSGKKSNMYDCKTDKKGTDMSRFTVDGFQIEKYYKPETPYIQLRDFFGDDNTYYVIRHKEGSELCAGGAAYDPKTAIYGVTEEYRYYDYYNMTDQLGLPPEVTPESARYEVTPKVGNLLANNGKFYAHIDSIKKDGLKAVGIVVCVTNGLNVENDIDYNGLVMSLYDLTDSKLAWTTSNPEKCKVGSPEDKAALPYVLDGIQSTLNLAGGCGKGHTHNMATFCQNFDNGIQLSLRKTNGFSDWFIPSTGQWIYAMEGMGLKWNEETSAIDGLYSQISEWFYKAGVQKLAPNFEVGYWTSTEENAEKAYYIDKTQSGKVLLSNNITSKNTKLLVRPFLAFGRGGLKNKLDPRIKVYEDRGYFVPGMIMQDVEDGTYWMCYANWEKNDILKTVDQKSRFISLNQNYTTATETISGMNQTGTFVNSSDLIPEKYILEVGGFFSFVLNNNASHAVTIKNNIKQYFGIDVEGSWTAHRDSAFNSGKRTTNNPVLAFNLMYTPEGGRKTGTQPYLRYIIDGTHVGGNRPDLPDQERYYSFMMYRKYNDNSGRKQDLTDLFTFSNVISNDNPVKADKWSSLRRHDTGQRDGDFTAADRYSGAFDARLFLDGNKYLSAYREPVYAVRYLEIDDPTNGFQKTYNGRKYRLIFNVEDPAFRYIHVSEFWNAVKLTIDQNVPHPWAYMDNDPYRSNILIFAP